MKVIIRPNFILMNRPLIDAEMEENSIVYRDNLFSVVPMEKLKQCYDNLNKRKTTSSFAPNFFDIKNEWLAIEAKENAEKAKQLDTERARNPVIFCPNRENHIPGTNGEIIVYMKQTDTDEKKPCQSCRYQDSWKWQEYYNAMYGEFQPKTMVDAVLTDAPVEERIYLEKINLDAVENPIELIDKSIDQIKKEMITCVGTSRFDELQGEWISAINKKQFYADKKDGE